MVESVFNERKTVQFTCDWDGNDYDTLDLKNSNTVSIEGTMFPINNPEGKLTNVVLIWIDYAKQKKSE